MTAHGDGGKIVRHSEFLAYVIIGRNRLVYICRNLGFGAEITVWTYKAYVRFFFSALD